MKRIFAILLIVVVLGAVLVACTDKPPQTPPTGDGNTTPEQPSGDNTQQPNEQEVTKMYITVNGNKLEVTLAKNNAVTALVERLQQGDVTYTANDYGGFEKVGSLGFSLPTSNTQITTEPGDVLLYSGNQIVLFYGSNTWSYTRLGKIEGYTASQLAELLGAGLGSVTVTLSLR